MMKNSKKTLASHKIWSSRVRAKHWQRHIQFRGVIPEPIEICSIIKQIACVIGRWSLSGSCSARNRIDYVRRIESKYDSYHTSKEKSWWLVSCKSIRIVASLHQTWCIKSDKHADWRKKIKNKKTCIE